MTRLLTKTSDYAIRALIYLARDPGRYIPSSEIVRETAIPGRLARRILQVLTRDGILASREGSRGGVRLIPRPRDIPITRILRLFQGEVRIVECLVRKQICANREACVLRREMMRIEVQLIRSFDRITVGSLVADLEADGRRPPGKTRSTKKEEFRCSADNVNRHSAGRPAKTTGSAGRVPRSPTSRIS